MTTVPVRRHNHVRRLASDRVFDGVLYTIAAILTLTALYPMYFIIIASISDPSLVAQGKILLLPRGVTLEGYEHLASMKNLWVGYGNTILYTIAGTAIMLVVNIPVAYALSRRDLVGRRWFTLFFVFPMFFGGGLIPTYIVASTLHLVNTRWILIMFGSVSVYNMILIRTFCGSTIPEELREAASMDGCSNTRFFFTFVLPLSKAIIAVIALYVAVAHWNNYYNALVYTTDASLQPLQLYLRHLLLMTTGTESIMESDANAEVLRLVQTVRYAVIVLSALPIMCLYPFLQKYFVQGVMIGSIKG
mgnify:CR=1 FL=1